MSNANPIIVLTVSSKAVLLCLLFLLTGCTSGGLVEKLTGIKDQTSVFSSPASDRVGNGQHIVGLLVADEDNSLTDGLSNSFYLSGKLAAESLKGSPITLVVRRHNHTKKSLNKAVSEILRAGARIIIGPDGRVDMATLSALSRDTRVPIITIGQGADPDRNIFSASLSQTEEAKLAAAEMKKRGHKSAIIAHSNKAASLAYAQTLIYAIKDAGIITHHLNISDPSKVFETLDGIFESDRDSPDAIIFATGALQAGKLIKSMGNNPKFSQLEMIGHSGWAVAAEHIPQDRKIWFTSLRGNTLSKFSKKFQAVNEQHPSLLGAIAYDLVVMAGVLPQVVPETPYASETLTSQLGFNGLTGPFAFDKSGKVHRVYVIDNPK